MPERLDVLEEDEVKLLDHDVLGLLFDEMAGGDCAVAASAGGVPRMHMCMGVLLYHLPPMGTQHCSSILQFGKVLSDVLQVARVDNPAGPYMLSQVS